MVRVKKIGWTAGGKFNLSDNDVLTISPDKKNLYQTASFLILLNYFYSKTTTEIEIKVNEK